MRQYRGRRRTRGRPASCELNPRRLQVSSFSISPLMISVASNCPSCSSNKGTPSSTSSTSAVGDLVSSSAFVPSRGITSFGTFVTLCGGQACRPGTRRDGTGSGCGGENTAKHFGQTIGSVLRSKNFVLQLLQR